MRLSIVCLCLLVGCGDEFTVTDGLGNALGPIAAGGRVDVIVAGPLRRGALLGSSDIDVLTYSTRGGCEENYYCRTITQSVFARSPGKARISVTTENEELGEVEEVDLGDVEVVEATWVELIPEAEVLVNRGVLDGLEGMASLLLSGNSTRRLAVRLEAEDGRQLSARNVAVRFEEGLAYRSEVVRDDGQVWISVWRSPRDVTDLRDLLRVFVGGTELRAFDVDTVDIVHPEIVRFSDSLVVRAVDEQGRRAIAPAPEWRVEDVDIGHGHVASHYEMVFSPTQVRVCFNVDWNACDSVVMSGYAPSMALTRHDLMRPPRLR